MINILLSELVYLFIELIKHYKKKMNKEFKDCLLAIVVIAAIYSSMYLFYYASKYLGYIY